MSGAFAKTWSDMKEGFKFGQEQSKQKIAEQYEEIKMPYATYNWILFKCFDSCVGDFDNKSLDAREGTCVDECVTNLKDAPETFGRGQMFSGFKGNKTVGYNFTPPMR